ncbi:MAG: HD family phosphohydrolase [Kiritimatiellia bacterium]
MTQLEKGEKMTTRERFSAALLATGRAGADKVLAGLEALGFFIAPASTRFHGAHPGGLAEHSLNVYTEAMMLRALQIKLRPELESRLPADSVAITALLHDVCKAEVYRQIEKFRKDESGKWEKYTCYGVDYSALPIGHGEKSVIRLLRLGLEMTEDEMLAIRWHMQGFDLADSAEARGNYGAACAKCPLLGLLMSADLLAAHVLESE